MDIVIVKIGSGPIMFYSGGNWSEDYPDAFMYTNPVKAKMMVKNLVSRGVEGVMVIGDYGMDSEVIL